MSHGFTTPSADCQAELDRLYPEGDAAADHTPECDQASCGDACIGGCPITLIDTDTCTGCGLVFAVEDVHERGDARLCDDCGFDADQAARA